jgi:hypothetical protein
MNFDTIASMEQKEWQHDYHLYCRMWGVIGYDVHLGNNNASIPKFFVSFYKHPLKLIYVSCPIKLNI